MKALEGLKVVEFAFFGVAPQSAQCLANCGATVVKVESSARHDPFRLDAPFGGGKVGLNRGGCFALFNANKYGITLNLKHPKAKDIAIRLIKWADVMIEGYTPGSIQKLGLDYKTVIKFKPDIIYLSTCAEGQTGPDRTRGASGADLAAIAGFDDLTGWPDRGPSTPSVWTDFVAYHFAVITIMAALAYRQETGKGQYIDLSQFECGVQFLATEVLDYSANERINHRAGNRCREAAPHGAFPCKGSDKWVAIAVFNDKDWKNLCQAMGEPPRMMDERFSTMEGRKQNEDELEKLVADWTLAYTPEEVMRKLQESGVCAGVVQTSEDLHNDPQLKHRHHFWKLEHPEIGWTSLYEAPSFHLSETPVEITMPAPCIGQHNDYVYTQLLEMSDEEFLQLLSEGVIDSI